MVSSKEHYENILGSIEYIQEWTEDMTRKQIESDLKKLGSPIPTLYLDYDKVPSGKFYKSGKKKGEPVMEKGRKQENIYECRVDKGTSFIPLEIKERWAYEANNEFTSNIIVDDWKLPIGAKNTEQSGAT